MIGLVGWIMLAGGVGAVVRYAVTLRVPQRDTSQFPYAILIVNLSGSLIAGVTFGLLSTNRIPVETAVVLWAGLCGGLTTFSTFAVDTILLARSTSRTSSSGASRHAVVNVLVTIAGGVVLATAGSMFVHWAAS